MAVKFGLTLTIVSLVIGLIALASNSLHLTEAEASPVEEQYDSPIPPPKGDIPQSYYDNWGGLKPGHGREETFFACVVCHTEGRIIRSHMTRKQWKETLDRLSDFHEVPPLEPDEEALILDYLGEHYGPKFQRP